MNDTDRAVRAAVYECFVDAEDPTAAAVARRSSLSEQAVLESFANLESEHRIVLDQPDHVRMAHPFSSVDTGYDAVLPGKTIHANCAWDAFAILALLGDGEVTKDGQAVWTVDGGTVAPDGIIHFVVPPRDFWADIGFT